VSRGILRGRVSIGQLEGYTHCYIQHVSLHVRKQTLVSSHCSSMADCGEDSSSERATAKAYQQIPLKMATWQVVYVQIVGSLSGAGWSPIAAELQLWL
jgi:hypothetical protein